jgi:hypothetical protein
LTWLLAALYSGEIWLPAEKCSGEIWLPLHNVAERFDSPLHHAAGSQTLILVTPWIWKHIRKKLRVWIKVQGGGDFWWKKTEVEYLTLLSL